ncbi:GGDEF domain-containing protein [Litoribacillus peritrichatus]|uniref:GGDEF domain-containing protein n=1 Tax=Litoribacillus peritrichatus TaxID=718191 RepID=UPI0031E144D1
MSDEIQQKQKIRLKRLMMAVAAYVVCGAIVWLYYLTDQTEQTHITEIAMASSLSLILQAAFYLFIKSGKNLRFKDPSLTIQQMIPGFLWVTYLLSITQSVRGVVLVFYFVILMFGIFRLTARQYLALSLLALIGYGLIIAKDVALLAPHFNLTLNLVQWAVLAILLIWFSYFGHEVHELRNENKVKKSQLIRKRMEIERQRDEIRRTNNELQAVLSKLSTQATTDELTGLANRRHFIDCLRPYLEQSTPESEFSVCLLDLDHFKQVNDRYGHIIGDLVLKRFAETARKCLRKNDLLARYGGEEFILFLPRADKYAAMECAERIRTEFGKVVFDEIPDAPSFTLSIGVTLYSSKEDHQKTESLIARADAALYNAKQRGRNQVILAEPANNSHFAA